MILALSIQDTCRMTPAQTNFFLTAQAPATEGRPPSRSYSSRPLPRCPVTPALVTRLGPTTPPMRRSTDPPAGHSRSLRTLRPYRIPHRLLRIVNLYGGLAIGLEALISRICDHLLRLGGQRPCRARGGFAPPPALDTTIPTTTPIGAIVPSCARLLRPPTRPCEFGRRCRGRRH